MNGNAHANIMAGAFAALPADKQQFAPFLDLLKTAPNYPDYFDDPTRPVADKIRIDPEWQRFCRLPASLGGGESLHTWGQPIAEQRKYRPIVEYWCSQAIDSYRAGDFAAYLKFIGCLSHMLGDTTQPAHLVNQALIDELMPAPAHLPNFHFHNDVEAVTGECGQLKPPQLLGISLEEISWRIAARNRRDMRTCRAYIVPTLQTLFEGDLRRAAALAEPPVTLAAQTTLDLLYSTLLLARGEITEAHQQALASVDLRTLDADEQFHDLVYGGPIIDGNRNTPPAGAPIIRCKLRVNGTEQTMPGVGMLPHSGMSGPRDAWMRFDLPAGVFDRFEAVIGMNTQITRDGAAGFIVELDGKCVYSSGRRTVSDNATPISVAIGGATQMTLRVVDVNDGRTFWNNHAFWGEPRLVRRKLAATTREHAEVLCQTK